jgi:glyoxylase-like metal-dependent hydrolase (beta-lactamase superfamily II)
MLLLVACGSASAQTHKPYDVIQLAPDVHALVWRETLVDPIEANVLIVINRDDVLLVDSSFLPSTAKRIVAEVKKLTQKPVRFVVNTHWHNDHVQGNGVYRDAWPGMQFISHARTREDALEYAFGDLENGRRQMHTGIETLQRWLKEGKDDAGKPIDAERRKRIEIAIPMRQQMIDELAGLPTVAPTITFEDRLVLHLGERRIEVLYLGLGNTRGDAVVFLPQERIVATGDLVVHPEPFGFGSYYKPWIDTLARLAALDADIFVPGHGPVMRDRSYIETLRALLRDLTQQVDAAVAKGLSLEDTKKAVTLETWKPKLAGSDDRIKRAFDQFFVAPAVERAWKQATNAPGAFGQKIE